MIERIPVPQSPEATAAIVRVPPHSLEAEEALLGSVLLDPDILSTVVPIVRPEDFYRSAHRRIFEVCVSLYDRGEPADAVLVLRECERLSILEDVGGQAALARLAGVVATPANAEHYAKVVREKAISRDLIHAAADIQKAAYDEAGRGDELLEEAEQRIFALGRSQDLNQGASVASLLRDVFTELEARETGGGIHTGYYEFDDLTGGLHPGELVIVAGRPSMGKTTFALNVAANVVLKSRIPTAVFSLEMSRQQIAKNVLCSLARFEARKLRSGKFLSDEDYRRLLDAAQPLYEAPLYVDDTPGLTTTALRARARRLRQRHEVGLFVIDYMQLMEAVGQSRSVESRQQEISFISRSLKGLARELNVPVIAISQLNRAADAREDHRPRLSDLRECVTGDTLVLLADGSRIPIRDLVGTTPDVVSVDAHGKLTTARSDLVWRVGRRPVFRVRLASGRAVRATADHRLRGAEGWVRVRDLREGDRLALARRLPQPVNARTWPEGRLALLGQMIGDGSYLRHQPMRYTTASEANSRAVSEAATREFGAVVRRYPGRGRWHQLVIGGNGNRWHPNGVNAWLRELGVYGQRSYEKRVPSAVFRLDDGSIACLLRHLWATDGCIHVPDVDGRPPAVYYSTTSEGLAGDVVALLLRLSIVARIRRVPQGRYRPSVQVHIHGGENECRFLDTVGAFGPRLAPAERLDAASRARPRNTNVDTLPIDVFARVRARMQERGVSQRRMAALRGTSYGGTSHFRFAPSRAVIAEYAEILGDEALRAEAESDLFWDRVVAVEAAGEEEVFDLTVPETSCWLADGIVSHNSGSIEQDADVICFLYRPHYYSKAESDKGTAEVIVAKQRNGPTDTIRLAFVDSWMLFDNLAFSGQRDP